MFPNDDEVKSWKIGPYGQIIRVLDTREIKDRKLLMIPHLLATHFGTVLLTNELVAFFVWGLSIFFGDCLCGSLLLTVFIFLSFFPQFKRIERRMVDKGLLERRR